ncbi:hypothetical protein C8Q72DRAFT_79979 [Fomitopsis betulina]|nr:hypothetical protein C8Q72DRAFT_79979 [Fomitopsis betulina]
MIGVQPYFTLGGGPIQFDTSSTVVTTSPTLLTATIPGTSTSPSPTWTDRAPLSQEFPTSISSMSSTPSTSSFNLPIQGTTKITTFYTQISDGATTIITVTEPEPRSVTTSTEPPTRSVITGNGSTSASSRVHAIIPIIGSVLGVVLLISVVLYARWRWHRGNTNDSLRGRRLDITGEDSVHNAETNKHSIHVSSNGDISRMDRCSPGDVESLGLNCSSEAIPTSLATSAPSPLRHSFPDSKAPSGTVLPALAANYSEDPGLLRRSTLSLAPQENTILHANTNTNGPWDSPPEGDVQPQPRAFGPRAPLISYEQLFGVRPLGLHHCDPDLPILTQESVTRRRQAVDGGIVTRRLALTRLRSTLETTDLFHE